VIQILRMIGSIRVTRDVLIVETEIEIEEIETGPAAEKIGDIKETLAEIGIEEDLEVMKGENVEDPDF